MTFLSILSQFFPFQYCGNIRDPQPVFLTPQKSRSFFCCSSFDSVYEERYFDIHSISSNFFALYHSRIAPVVNRRLAARRLDLLSMIAELPRIELAPPAGWSRAANVNTRAALSDWIETNGVPAHA